MPKRSIRDELLIHRRNLDSDACLNLSLAAQERLLFSTEFAEAAVVALYCPVRNEVLTDTIFDVGRSAGKMVAYPRVRGSLLEFVHVEQRLELVPGAYGIPEPIGSQVIPLTDLGLIVVPGVAFDFSGHRLGYGKGYYDRFLQDRGKRGVLAGLCFDFQLVESLPAETHDVRMDLVITEERILRFC